MPYAFPGFADTVRIVQNSIYDIPEGHPSADDRRAGTRRLMLLSLARTDDHLDALVCDDQAGLYFEKNIGHKHRGLPPLFDLRDGRWFMPDAFPYSVSLRKSGTSVWHPTVDRDTDRAPNWNAFTGWTAKQNRLNLDGSNSILCSNWASRNYPGIPSGQSQGLLNASIPRVPRTPLSNRRCPKAQAGPGWGSADLSSSRATSPSPRAARTWTPRPWRRAGRRCSGRSVPDGCSGRTGRSCTGTPNPLR